MQAQPVEVPITTNPSGRQRSALNSQCRSFEGVQAALFSVSLSHRRLELQIRFCALYFDFGVDHRFHRAAAVISSRWVA